ncbi:MAG: hypothetical protein WCD56_14165 [Pseudolabrys sp.]|jgi:hypothetical protein
MPRLSAPTQMVFVLSVIFAIVALIGHFFAVAAISSNAFWIAILAYVVLAAGCVLKGV